MTLLPSCKKQDETQPEIINVAARGNSKKPDRTKPVVKITEPLTGTVIAPGATFTVKATATDNIGVKKVAFTFNGLYKSMTIPPYEATYIMPSFVTDGMIMPLIVEADDEAGKTGFDMVYFTVGQP